MAKFIVAEGTDNYIKKLEELLKDAEPGMRYALYFGAEELTNAVRAEIGTIPVSPKNHSGKKYIDTAQRDGLLAGLGISKMKNENGFVNVRIGFDGYNSKVTDNYPKGQPNSLIARSIVSGTSFRSKNNFIGRAVSKSKAKAEKAISDAFDRYVKGIMDK